jgi:hypothetical protein
MSETGYLIWFIALSVAVVGLLVAFVMASMGWFTRTKLHEFPNERSHDVETRASRQAKQYWPHTSALREDRPRHGAAH